MTAIPEIARRLVGGQWRTNVVDEGGGNGGSQPGITDPTDLDDLQIWLDASQLSLADDADVTTWPDLSGNDFDAAQSDAAHKPVCKTNALNGQRVVRFVAGAGFKQLTFSGDALAILDGAPGLTAFCVMTNRDNASTGENDWFWMLGGDDENGTIRRCQLEMDTTAGYFQGFIADDLQNTLTSSSTLVQSVFPAAGGALGTFVACSCFDFNKLQAATYLAEGGKPNDSGSTAGGPAIPFSDAASAMGLSGDGGGYYTVYPLIDADLAEVIVYNRPLNALERRQVLEYLSAKWGTL